MIRLSFFGNHRIRLMRLMRLKCLLRPVQILRSIHIFNFWYAPVSSSSLGQISIWGVFFLFFFWAERLRLRANHLGRGGGNIYLCICTLTLTKSHFLGKKVLSHPYGFSSNFLLLACWGFAPLTRSSAGKRSPWGGFFFYHLISVADTYSLFLFGSSWVKLLRARIDGVFFSPSPGGLFVCVFLA